MKWLKRLFGIYTIEWTWDIWQETLREVADKYELGRMGDTESVAYELVMMTTDELNSLLFTYKYGDVL